ncbi:hypothetical protein ABW20_dc0103452 [Dactylellina cionopaga]|nr:hypothetical protein ABW20_dc0103452 [Dactylellina cionopaga]
MSSTSNRDHQPSDSATAYHDAVAPSRRRSFSPDPESVDSRRSSRIRRRISRFVSANIATDHTLGRDSAQHSNPINESTQPAVENISTSAPRVRLARIRSGLLHRRRSLNATGLDSNRRERPFSMITPRLGSLPFHVPRDGSSLDLPQSHLLRTPERAESALSMVPEPSILSPSDNHSSETQIDSDHYLGRGLLERNIQGDAFSARRNTPGPRHMRPRRAHVETDNFDPMVMESSQSSDSTPHHPFLPTTQSRPSVYRPSRDSRGSGSSNPSRPGRSGEDQAAVLSRLLSVAAAATAASLVGSNVHAFSDARDVSSDSVDGSFESFLRALQNGRLASALRNGGGTSDSPGPDSSDDIISTGSIGPLNFFRMFRFGPTPTSSDVTTSETTEQGRMVPVIIVGIRSVNPRDTNLRDGRPSPPFLDAFSAAPLPNDSGSRRGSIAGRPPLARSHHLPVVEDRDQNDIPASIYSTPATTSSNESGPASLRNSSSIPPPESLSIPLSDSSTTSSETSEWTTSSTSSDDPQRFLSSQVSHDNLPSRSISPDSSQHSTEGTRSWIIYVLGGSYPENHPILTTPSLFTDVSFATTPIDPCGVTILSNNHFRLRPMKT